MYCKGFRGSCGLEMVEIGRKREVLPTGEVCLNEIGTRRKGHGERRYL